MHFLMVVIEANRKLDLRPASVRESILRPRSGNLLAAHSLLRLDPSGRGENRRRSVFNYRRMKKIDSSTSHMLIGSLRGVTGSGVRAQERDTANRVIDLGQPMTGGPRWGFPRASLVCSTDTGSCRLDDAFFAFLGRFRLPVSPQCVTRATLPFIPPENPALKCVCCPLNPPRLTYFRSCFTYT